MSKVNEAFEIIKSLTLLEAAELVKQIEEAFGVSASAAMPMMAMAAPGAAAPAEEAEETDVSVILASVGANKINVLKEIRAITGLGLKEAKDLVDNAPKPVKEGIKKEEAAEIKKKLEEQGAVIEIK
jgi:large subunit ribosomal protein L7/L12